MTYAKFAAVLLFAALPFQAFAQSAVTPPATEKSEARAKVREACGADMQKFCAGVERAKGAMRACLVEHEKDLSAECKAARDERAAARGKEKS
jgi:hypothetical protein